MRIRIGVGILGVIFVAGAWACSSSSTSTASPTDAGGGDDAGEGGPAPTGTVSVRVLAPTYPATGVVDAPSVAGAVVAIDKPGGEHVEAMSDADGKVTFDAIDWSAGNAAIVAYKDGAGLSAYGVAEVNPQNFASLPGGTGPGAGSADVVLYLFPLSFANPVALTVQFANKIQPGDGVSVGATTGLATAENNKTSGVLSVFDKMPYTLVAREYTLATAASPREIDSTTVHWWSFDEPAPSAPTAQVSIDLTAGGAPLVPTTTHAKVIVPGGETGPLAGCKLYGFLSSRESFGGALLGSIATTALEADKSTFDVTYESNTVAGQTPMSFFNLVLSDGTYTQVLADGGVGEGAVFDEFLTPMPALHGTQSYGQAFDLTGAPPDTVTRFNTSDGNTTFQLWVDVPPNTKTLHLPTMPAALHSFVKKNASVGLITSLADLGAGGFFVFQRATAAPSFALTVP